MSFRTDILPIVNLVRTKRGPGAGGYDIQTVKLDIVKRTWSGAKRGIGQKAETVLASIPQHVKIRSVTAKEIAGSGGTFKMEDQRVGPITPKFTGGGFQPSDLEPTVEKGAEVVYRLTGSVNGDYALLTLNTDKAFSYFMVLRRQRTTP